MGAKYRAEHIGSLLRPAELLKARGANLAREELRALEDRHIQTRAAAAKDLGFKIFTDGELRRNNFMSDLNDSVEGIDQGDTLSRTWRSGPQAAGARPSGVPGGRRGQDQTTQAFDRTRIRLLEKTKPGRH